MCELWGDSRDFEACLTIRKPMRVIRAEWSQTGVFAWNIYRPMGSPGEWWTLRGLTPHYFLSATFAGLGRIDLGKFAHQLWLCAPSHRDLECR